MTRVSPASYSAYAPLRYEITRPFSKKLAQKAASAFFLKGGEGRKKVLNDDLWGILAKTITFDPLNPSVPVNESINLTAYSEFFSEGRIIFDFHKKLTAALLDTDADRMPLSSISFPNRAFYLHFGDFEWPEDFGLNIEGVYISKTLDNNYTCINFHPVKKRQFMSPVHIENNNTPESSSFLINLDDGIVSIEDYIIKDDESIREAKSELDSVSGNSFLSNIMGFTTFDSKVNGKVARIVVNCLLYLSAVPNDVFETWDDRAPRALVETAENGEKEGSRKTAQRTLINQDYLKVRFVGRKFSQGAQKIGNESNIKQVTHIRRGHFRNQAYGPEWTLHRVIFIPPVLINPDSGEIPGRIYET